MTNRQNRRGRLFEQQKGRCWLCGDLMRLNCPPTDDAYATFDHVTPKSLGGKNGVANIRLAHKLCNNQRGSAEVAEPPPLEPLPWMSKRLKPAHIDNRDWIKVYQNGRITVYEPAP